MGDEFDPYYRWLAIPPEQQPADHYRLLGLKRFESAADVIEVAADRQMLHIRNFAAGKHAGVSQRLLNEISAARLCLLDAKQRAAYDKQLRARFAQQAKKPAAKAAPAPAKPASELDGLSQVAPPQSPLRRAKARKLTPAWIPAALVLGMIAAGGGVYFFVTQQNAANGTRKPPVKIAAKVDTKKTPAQLGSNHDDKPFFPAGDGPAVERPLPDRPAKVSPPPVGVNNPPDAATDERGAGADVFRPIERPPLERVPPEQGATSNAPLSAPPAETEQLAALAGIKERYRADFGKLRQPEQKQSLARKLLRLSGQAKQGAAERYVLIHEGATLAAAGGDADTALKAAQQLGSEFEIDAVALRTELLTSAAKGAHTPDEHRAIAKHAESAIAEAIADDQFEAAQQLVKTASAAAARAKDAALGQPIRELARQIDQLEAAYRKAKPALEALAANADDADAALTVGKYYCFAKADWARGLPLLARGPEPALRALAEQDLASPTDAEEQLPVGDAWWDVADELPKEVRGRVRGRAAHWYETAASRLSESNRTRVNKRLAEISASDRGPARKAVYLDDLEEQQSITHYGPVGRRGRTGPQGSIAVVYQGAGLNHSLSVVPPANAPSLVVYQLDGRFSRFQGTATLIDWETPPESHLVFKVLGDGRLLWQSRPIQRRVGRVGEAQECDVSIRGVRELRLIVELDGPNIGADGLWIDPRVVP